MMTKKEYREKIQKLSTLFDKIEDVKDLFQNDEEYELICFSVEMTEKLLRILLEAEEEKENA